MLREPLPRLLAQVGLIILVSRVLGILMRKLGQPTVIAEITAGILLGPSLFGWLFPDAYGLVFASDSLKVLSLVSQLGLVLFMFLIGLELDLGLLRGRAHTSVAISHASIVAPFAMGSALAFFLHERLAQPNVSVSSFALFMGAAMSITAFPVLARILTEQRLLKTKVGALTITCAAVDDVTAWCILAFVVAITRATGIRSALVTTVAAAGYILVMFGLIRPILQRVAARSPGRETLSQNVVAGTLLVLFLSSWVTELIGIHALFGAFLFGAILPKQGGFTRALSDKLEDLVLVVLLPLFFAYSGVRTQLGLLSSAESWAICLLIIAVACMGKFGASTLVARLTGLSWRESSALGVLMNTRGLMELIVLNIGLDLGVIGPTLFTMMVVMALVTTFSTTPLLRAIYPQGMPGELPVPGRNAVPASQAFTVLLCVADQRVGPGLLTFAASLCSDARARIYALTLLLPSERGSFSERAPEEGAESTLRPLLARAHELSVKVSALSFTSTDPPADILRVARTKGIDLILLGSHKPLLGQSLLGGTVYRVMKTAESDVGVLVDRGLQQVRRILVPFMGTPHDYAALELANRALSTATTEVTVLHVIDPERRSSSPILGAESAVDSAFRETTGAKVIFRVVHAPDATEAVLRELAGGFDLAIIGMGRDWGLEERAFGISRERLLSESPVSLLVVRRALAPESAPQSANSSSGSLTSLEAR